MKEVEMMNEPVEITMAEVDAPPPRDVSGVVYPSSLLKEQKLSSRDVILTATVDKEHSNGKW